ncbi:DNMT1-RFD domain-containing protein [Trichophyton interdigitale]|uniref:DNMT1-RFD domain-containing protein n=1 Tax=Trichophyton interdigitale TaxID=101480 RepID=A0A9P4YLK4_9EURO|nr:DNMT1-RFD domain-containing protein [Trichophyton interdigitale]KAF3899799.1 DNMT1-RFD domain-containing protein [Trichophyton interdigitale]
MSDATLCISNIRQLPEHRELCVDTIRHHGGFGDMTARIEKVLASKDPGLTDENDWEEFSLKDVKVYIPGKTRYANILSASEDNPLMVTGQLEEVDEDQESLVLDGDYLQKRVVIQNVTHYAYGQDGDGGVGIWAAGDAGWFSISPAKGYKPMFQEVVEAVDLLYFLVDQYQPKKRKGKNRKKLTWEFLLDEYTRHTHGACEDAEESLEVFNKHHEFLIRQMVQGKEDIDWPSTSVYSHLREEFPDLFNDPHSEEDSKSDVIMENSPPGDNTEENSQANAIFEIILEMKDAGLLAQRKLHLKSVAEELLEKYEMSSLEDAINLVNSRAGSVIKLMDEAQGTASSDWHRRAIYRQLKEATELEDIPPVGATPLRRRQNVDASESSSESEADEDEVRVKKNRKRRNRKSILRPKTSEKAGKRNRDYASVDSEEEMEDILVAEDTPTKGGAQLLHESSPTENQGHPYSDGEANKGDKDGTAVVNGNIPPDTWVCPVTGCGKQIPRATLKRSKGAIDDHNLVHADDTQSKLDLVFAEQRLNVNVSVNNLLSRIRGLGGPALPDIMGDPIDPDPTPTNMDL